MSSGEVFVDCAALLAFINEDDGWHASASALAEVLAQATTPMVCSDWVLAEFLASAARSPLRARAVEVTSIYRSSPAITVVESSRPAWDRAFELYRSRLDKSWSLVDCSSMNICRDRRITRVFTSDRHFAQAGFEVLLT